MNLENSTIKDVKVKIAELTRLLRKNNRLSQEELASALALSRITIQNMERGKNVTIDNLLKVFQHFDCLEKFHSFIDQSISDNSLKSLY